MNKLPAYELPLCIDKINLALGLDLAPGKAWFSSETHEKTATKHAADYNLCIKHLGHCCEKPTYIGRHAKHPGNVELILEIAAEIDETVRVLVAVVLRSNSKGNYRIDSTYSPREDEVERRIRKGYVHKIG